MASTHSSESSAGPLRHRRHPCAECPWRRDVSPGQFSVERFVDMACTSGRPGEEAGLDAPLFACHKTVEGREQACSGWLAAVGYHHLGVRLAVAMGRLDPLALEPGEGWPELFASYAEMTSTQALQSRTGD
ncbi:DUF6283 family protein [Nocardia cyriacigeorgica]|uniref:DUF6283 family protein n=1 Tax=Nocardia cyriacigeorgica TaxID=135487 RepID=UPI002B4AC298|nr:DUF6283 family protein [Nocardia cyriacigeorgica]